MARQKTKKRASKQIKNRKKRLLLPYPLILFLLLCAGAYLVATTLKTAADSIIVTAKVSAPFVTSPAVITAPPNGAHFKSIPVNVVGTCPANAGYVEIFRNNLMSGTAICSSGAFQLSVDLFPGQNNLVAHVFNITDDEGPISSAVTVYYDVPQSPPATSQSGGSSPTTNLSSPLTLKTAFVYKGYYVGQKIDWPLQISGGTPPYAVNVDWGDGSNSVISLSKAGEFQVEHIYPKPGDSNGSYQIKVSAADAARQTAFIQFFVIVNVEQTSLPAGNIFSKPTPSLGNGLNWLWVAWPAYAIISVMALSYWLGEREEMLMLRKKGLLKHHA